MTKCLICNTDYSKMEDGNYSCWRCPDYHTPETYIVELQGLVEALQSQSDTWARKYGEAMKENAQIEI